MGVPVSEDLGYTAVVGAAAFTVVRPVMRITCCTTKRTVRSLSDELELVLESALLLDDDREDI